MTKIRSLLVTIPIAMATTAALILASLVAMPFSRKGRAQRVLSRLWACCILRICRVKVRMEGSEGIAPPGPYIVIANHSSLIDVPVLVAHLPVDLCFLVKKELFRVPLFGTYLRRAGHIAVDRSGGKSSIPQIVRNAFRSGSGRKSLLIFPEGTRSGSLGEFKDGAAWFAIRSSLPVIPLGISGASQVWPGRSAMIHGGIVEVRAGQPIPTAGLQPSQRRQFALHLRETIERLLNLEPGPGALHPSD